MADEHLDIVTQIDVDLAAADVRDRTYDLLEAATALEKAAKELRTAQEYAKTLKVGDIKFPF